MKLINCRLYTNVQCSLLLVRLFHVSCVLLGHILHCLTKCFMYNRGGNFLTKERFDALIMQPLVNQVSGQNGV